MIIQLKRPILGGNVKCIRRARSRMFGYSSCRLKLKRFRLRLCANDWYWLIVWVVTPSVGAAKVVYSESKKRKETLKQAYVDWKRNTYCSSSCRSSGFNFSRSALAFRLVWVRGFSTIRNSSSSCDTSKLACFIWRSRSERWGNRAADGCTDIRDEGCSQLLPL